MYCYAPLCRALVAPLLVGAVGYGSQPAAAQIIPDGTLGEESSVVNTVAPQVELIEGGAQRGEHLFHSFEEFNIDEGWTANFANPEGIFNILSRVTGENPSNLFGTLGVLGGADLFFINPNGVIFGPHAQLQIPGSFTVSTADSLILPDGSAFSASNPGVPPLLTVDVDVPIGVRFDDELAAALSSEAMLEVGADLTLSGGDVVSAGLLYAPEGHVAVEGVAGDVTVQDLAAQSAVLTASGNLVLEESRLWTAGDLSLLAGDTVWVRDSEANPFFAVAGGDLLVQGNEQVDIFALNHPNSELQSYGNMLLRSANTIIGDAYYWSGGDFRIENLNGRLGDLESPYDPVIRVLGDVEFGSYTGDSLHVLAGGSVKFDGDIVIEDQSGASLPEEEITLANGNPQLLNGLLPEEQKITINGDQEPTLDIRAGTVEVGEPNVTPSDLDLPLGFIPPFATSVDNDPNSANITITGGILNSVFIPNESGDIRGRIYLTNQYEPDLSLSEGVISVNGTTNNIDGGDGSSITAFGNPVTIDARTGINIANGIDSSAAESEGSNIILLSEGDIEIGGNNEGRSLFSVSNAADAGDIIIRANSDIRFPTGGIESEFFDDGDFPGASGDGGTVEVISNNGSISINGSVNSTSNAAGEDAGSITIEAVNGSISTGSLTADNSAGTEDIFSDGDNITLISRDTITTGSITTSAFSGESGNVTIDSRLGEVNTGSIKSSNQLGDSGDITITSSQGIDIRGDVDSVSFGPGKNAGNINITSSFGTIEVEDLRSFNNSIGSGNGGDISLNARGIVDTGSIVETSTLAGQSGSIKIVSRDGDIVSPGSIITSSQTGEAQFVELSADRNITVGNINTQVTNGSENAGDITITSTQGVIDVGSVTSASESGAAGDIQLQTGIIDNGDAVRTIDTTFSESQNIKTDDINSASGGTGEDGGNITLITQRGAILTGSLTSANTSNSNNNMTTPPENTDGGSIRLDAFGDIETGQEVRSSANIGESGDIEFFSYRGGITAGDIFAENASGDAGDISLETGDIIFINEDGNITFDETGELLRSGDLTFSENQKIEVGDISSGSGGLGDDGGDIILITQRGALSTGNLVSANTSDFDDGDMNDISDNTDGGAIRLDAFGDIETGEEIASSTRIGESGSVEIFSYRGGVTIASDGSGTITTSSDEAGANSVSIVAFRIIETGNIDSTAGGQGSPSENNIGNITIKSSNGPILIGDLTSSTFRDLFEEEVDAGNVVVSGFGQVTTGAIETSSDVDRSGNIDIESVTGSISTSSLITQTDSGTAGNITLDAQGNITTIGDVTSSSSASSGVSGDIDFTSSSGQIDTTAGTLSSTALDEGIAGDISLEADGIITVFNILTNGPNGSGSIRISTDTGLTINNGKNTSIRSETVVEDALAAGVAIEAPTMTLNDTTISATTERGQAGNITINENTDPASSVTLNNSSLIAVARENSANSTQSRAGNVTINALNVTLQGSSDENLSRISTRNENSANLDSEDDPFGNISFENLNELTVNNGLISTETQTGIAGDVTINGETSAAPASQVTLNNGSITAAVEQTNENSRAGNVTINALEVEVKNGSEISTSNENSAIQEDEREDFGNISFNNLDTLAVNNSSISTTTRTGVAGSVTINQSSSPEEPAEPASTITLNGGSITAQAERDELENTPVNVDSRAGNIDVNARTVTLSNESAISTSNESSIVPDNQRQNFGNVTFTNINSLDVTNSLISTETDTGTAGSVTVLGAESVILSGEVSENLLDPDFALAPSKPESGFLDPDQTENFSRAGIVAQATGEGGQAGSVNVQTHTLTLDDRAQVAASSNTENGVGNVIISANTIRLDNEARIIARNGAPGADSSENPPDPPSNGNPLELDAPFDIGDLPEDFLDDEGETRGNIILSVNGQEPIVRMFDESQINALATGDANGGNIAIYTLDDDGFVIANPADNSDIIASAQEGNGGRVFFGQETTDARTFVLGLRVRPALTIFSDIFVSSAAGAAGLVAFADPVTEGFLEVDDELPLPNAPALDEGCQVGFSGQQAEFFNFGLGGSPPRSDELIGGGSVLSNWIPFDLANTEATTVPSEINLQAASFAGPAFQRIPLIGNCQPEHGE